MDAERSVGPRVTAEFDDPAWNDPDRWSERDDQRADLIVLYLDQFGPTPRKELAVAVWLPDKGTFDRALKLAVDSGRVVRTAKGIYAHENYLGRD